MKGSWNKFFALAFLLLAGNAFAQTAPTDALDMYYKYSQQENIENFMSVFDSQGLSKEELDMQKEIALILWQKFDTLNYKITATRQTVKDNYALVDYKLNAKIKSITNEEAEISEDLTAFLVKNNNAWKINYIGNSDVFYERIESFAVESQSNVINEINKETLENKLMQKSIASEESNISPKNSNSELCAAPLIMFFAIGFFSIYKIKIKS